jgi:hypothetical protein
LKYDGLEHGRQFESRKKEENHGNREGADLLGGGERVGDRSDFTVPSPRAAC